MLTLLKPLGDSACTDEPRGFFIIMDKASCIDKGLELDCLVNVKTCQCKECTDVYLHKSDCLVHNEPADINGNCNCKSFEEAVKPLMKWLCENHHPMTTIIIGGNKAELVAGIKSVVTDEFVVD